MLLNLLLSLMAYRFLVISLAAIVFVVAIMIPKKHVGLKFLGVLIFILSLVNLLFGPSISNWAIDQHGETGMGVVLNKEETGDFYNEEPVVGYTGLIKTMEGQTAEISFESWDFNIYPRPENGQYNYPEPGVEFAVKYLPENPNHFVILAEEASDYSTSLNCENLKAAREGAERKMNFAKEDKAYQAEYEVAKKNYEGAECGEKEQEVSP